MPGVATTFSLVSSLCLSWNYVITFFFWSFSSFFVSVATFSLFKKNEEWEKGIRREWECERVNGVRMRMEWQWEKKRWKNPGRTRGGRGKIMGRGKEIHIWCWQFSSNTSFVEWYKLLASLLWCMVFNILLFHCSNVFWTCFFLHVMVLCWGT